jgi:glucokinase
MYEHDNRVVLTLDAGGTNFVFSAIKGGQEIIDPIKLHAVTDNLHSCLSTIVEGFRKVIQKLDCTPVAISFAFPGPADYKRGIIGDLPNFSAFKGGVALGPFLEQEFGIPVYINNDGNLFTYGEALMGILPKVNEELKASGSIREYKNLLGITLGTGFGAGVVIDKQLLTGDNGCGGDVWLMRNKKHPAMIAEESVSIRGVNRIYQERSNTSLFLEPKDIFEIAEGKNSGNRDAAIQSFGEFGEVAGDAIVHALDIVDGLVVIGGGISGAAKYILPSMIKEMNNQVGTFSGAEFPCLQSNVYNLEDERAHADFLKDDFSMVIVPGTDKQIPYASNKKIGVALSSLETSKAVSLGAYAFALNQLQ